MSTVFQLPKDGLTYTKTIFSRCYDLIWSDIWDDLDPAALRQWLKNFDSEELRYFAACTLDGLIYRSKNQTLALIKQLFQRSLSDLTRGDPSPAGHIDDWLSRLQGAADPGFRLVTAVRRKDPPTKSAHVVARYMKRNFEVVEDWIIKAWEVPKHYSDGIRIFIFIDDFLGSGDQFATFFHDESLNSIKSWYPVYAPLVAHQDGISKLKTELPQVRVGAVETLTNFHGIFDPASRAFGDGINTPEGAQEFYFDLLSKKGIPLKGTDRLGYGGLGIAFAFEHAAPDNSLPILWWRNSSEWQPLFPR